MMSKNLRREVLQVFKMLHRTRLKVFNNDEKGLKAVRNKINEEYRKNKNLTNTTAIEELNKFAKEVEHEIRTTVIQAVKKESGNFELLIKEDHLLDNATYKEPSSCKKNISDKKKS